MTCSARVGVGLGTLVTLANCRVPITSKLASAQPRYVLVKLASILSLISQRKSVKFLLRQSRRVKVRKAAVSAVKWLGKGDVSRDAQDDQAPIPYQHIHATRKPSHRICARMPLCIASGSPLPVSESSGR